MPKFYATVSITRGVDGDHSILIDGVEFAMKVKPGVRVEYVTSEYGDGAEVTLTVLASDLTIQDEVLAERQSAVSVEEPTDGPQHTVSVAPLDYRRLAQQLDYEAGQKFKPGGAVR